MGHENGGVASNGELQLNAYNLLPPSANGPTSTGTTTAATATASGEGNGAAGSTAEQSGMYRKFSIAQLTR